MIAILAERESASLVVAQAEKSVQNIPLADQCLEPVKKEAKENPGERNHESAI